MTLKKIINSEVFIFQNALQLKTFLNGFTDQQLEVLLFDLPVQDNLILHHETEELSDHSTVNNLRIASI